MNEPVKIDKLYGAAWCADCKRSRDFLDSRQISYNYIDIDSVAGAAEEVSKINKGYKSIPTIVFSDGSVLVEPSNNQLAEKLGLNVQA
jgi:glutaredoxin